MRARVIFMGTPDFAVPCVHAIANHPDCDLIAVVCQPDRVRGRKREPQPPPVKAAALALGGVQVLQPRRIKKGRFPERLEALAPDLIVVTAYGRILPPRILDLPRAGCVNVHASLLPRWRGAAPIQWSIVSSDRTSGVCLMEMEEGLDTGGVFARVETPITPEDTGETLHDRLSGMGARLLGDNLTSLLAGGLSCVPQSHEGITYAEMLTRDHGRVDWSLSADALADRIRGFYPWPGAFSSLGDRTLKLFPPVMICAGKGRPGEVLAVNDGLVVACGDGALRIEELQLQGKRRMLARDFLNGFTVEPGVVLGEAERAA